MRGVKAYVTLGVLLIGLLVAATAGNSSSTGITRQEGLTDEGCICHGPNRADDGVPSQAVEISFRLDPNVYMYEPGQSYNITIRPAKTDVNASQGAEANKGGFNLLVNIGELAAAEGYEEFIQGTSQEVTHTPEGDKNGRTFNLTWTAPGEDEGAAVFRVFLNTVNGDGSNSEEDHWTGLAVIIPGPTGEIAAAGGPENPAELGVNWLAHWVGVISFLAVAATLVIYYFVLKYGESIHTTDHRDRKG
jgi:hypothetical protein